MDIEKKVTEKKTWFLVAMGSLLISIVSLLLPVITYNGYGFNILALIGGDRRFESLVLNSYRGPVLWDLTGFSVSILAILAVAALVCAFVGLFTLRAQRPNTRNFILTIVGLIGVAVPSITVIFSVLALGRYYPGGLGIGIAPIISPIAIGICIYTVIRRKNKVAEEIRKEVEKKGLIWEAGDL